jgi:hypothetical protein
MQYMSQPTNKNTNSLIVSRTCVIGSEVAATILYHLDILEHAESAEV